MGNADNMLIRLYWYLTIKRNLYLIQVYSDCINYYYYYYVFILSAISPYTTGLEALFNPSDCTGTVPTHK